MVCQLSVSGINPMPHYVGRIIVRTSQTPLLWTRWQNNFVVISYRCHRHTTVSTSSWQRPCEVVQDVGTCTLPLSHRMCFGSRDVQCMYWYTLTCPALCFLGRPCLRDGCTDQHGRLLVNCSWSYCKCQVLISLPFPSPVCQVHLWALLLLILVTTVW